MDCFSFPVDVFMYQFFRFYTVVMIYSMKWVAMMAVIMIFMVVLLVVCGGGSMEGMKPTSSMYCIPSGTKLSNQKAVKTCCSKKGTKHNGQWFCGT
jgi:hypothetical protein